MPFITSWANALLDRAFRNVSFTAPSALEWAPYSSSPALDGTGGTEITTGGAARKTVSWATPASAQVASSGTVLATPVGTGATADWPLCTHFALHNATGGGMIAYGPTTPAKQVLTAAAFSLLAGEIQIADVAQATSRWLSWFTINGLLARLVGVGTEPTWVATPHWALFTALPSRDGSDPGAEVTGTGYARVAQACAAASGRSIAPSSSLDYGVAGSAWGEVKGLGAYTASTGGNLLGLLALDSSVVVSSGAPVLVPASSVAFTFS